MIQQYMKIDPADSGGCFWEHLPYRQELTEGSWDRVNRLSGLPEKARLSLEQLIGYWKAGDGGDLQSDDAVDSIRDLYLHLTDTITKIDVFIGNDDMCSQLFC